MKFFKIFRPKGKAAPRGGAVRSFAAAEVSRILTPWHWDEGFSNREISGSLARIRARSREMHKNSEHFAQFFRSFENNVVGQGFTLKAQPCLRADAPEIDETAKTWLQYHFWKWAKNRRECDLTEMHDFASLCRLVALSWARDGEAFVMIERGTASKYGVQLRVIRPDSIDETLNGDGDTKGTIIVNGVELDRATRRPVAYHVKSTFGASDASYNRASGTLRVKAADMIHVFKPCDAWQTRGIPLTHASLKKGKMLDEFNTAELVAARDEANTTGIYSAPAGRENEIVALNEDDDASNALCADSAPGTKLVLPAGWTYDTKTPQHPNREVGNFKNSMLRDIASGLGVEYACFANDWGGVSYSSVRAGTLAERDMWQVLQDEFIGQFVSRVYEAWLASWLSRPACVAYSPKDYERLVEHEFQPRTWAWVDPMRDVQADVIAVEHGWKTNEDVTAQYGGADFKENCARLAEENAAKKAAGIGGESEQPVADNKTEAGDDGKK